jgi:Protein of unknown function (DUF3500)
MTASSAADEIAGAVRAWLDSLDPTQLERATFPFESGERMVWDYVPGQREGLSLADMSAAQRDAARAVVEASMSVRGAGEVAAVIALEPILGATERESGRGGWIRRDPELYWFAVFGDPDGSGPWSWRVGGHHVAIHVTLADRLVIGSAPSFLGANPAVVPGGAFAGHRALTGDEALARALLAALSPTQRQVAIVDAVAPPDILTGSGPRADVRGVARGLRHGDMDGAQQTALEGLVRHYLERMRAEVAGAEWERIAAAGLADVTFAWAGPQTPGRGHYYAVRGPRFVVEYDNTQNGANHIHAVWRDLANDWGEDLLAAHYRVGHRETA